MMLVYNPIIDSSPTTNTEAARAASRHRLAAIKKPPHNTSDIIDSRVGTSSDVIVSGVCPTKDIGNTHT